MRSKRPSILRIASVLTELASHTVMGVAVGLAFALILLAVDQYGVARFINHSAAPEVMKLEFVGAVVLTFSFGATLTGLIFMFTEES
jgi:Na+-transporting methylmalonyl-CoA/oxaloacetate decarboxylase gamma subunit